MNPYQNYSQVPMMNSNISNSMNNYINGLQNQIMTMQNQIQNYQQALNNIQQPQIQQNPQIVGISTQIVDSFDNISANSVPMDNNGAIFALRDGSEIQTRRWTPDGKIATTSYKPILDNFENSMDNSSKNSEKFKIGLSDEVSEVLQNEFDLLKTRLDAIEQLLSNKIEKDVKQNDE